MVVFDDLISCFVLGLNCFIEFAAPRRDAAKVSLAERRTVITMRSSRGRKAWRRAVMANFQAISFQNNVIRDLAGIIPVKKNAETTTGKLERAHGRN